MSNNSQLPAPLVVENSGSWLGNDGSWSTFFIHVGTPAQTFHVLPSFSGQTLYVPIDQDCDRMNVSDCGSSRGVEVFDQRPSAGFQVNRSSTWAELGIYRVGMGTNFGFSGNGLFGNDTAGLGSGGDQSSIRVDGQAVSAYATPDFWLGELGLSMFALNMTETVRPHSFLSRLKEQGSVPSLSFGYQAGAKYRYTQIKGSLTLGGYDRSRIGNETLPLPITDDLIVGLQNLTASYSDKTVSLMTEGHLTVIDTSVPELWLPTSICDALATAFNLTYYAPADRYALTSSTYSTLQSLNPTFSLTLGSAVSGGANITIDLPYAALDLNASYPIFADSTRYFPIRRAANDTQYALGRVLLQEIYIAVDWERDQFNISKAHFSSPMPESDIVIITPKNGTESPLIPVSGPRGGKKLATGAIAGIAVGAVLVVVLALAAVWRFVIRRRREAKRRSEVVPVYDEDKKRPDGDDAPEAVGARPVNKEDERTDLELEGRPVAEMHAPHGQSEMRHSQERRTGEVGTGPAEVEGTSPLYELPSPGYPRS